MASTRILFIDDEEDFVSVVSDRLRSRGVNVDSAGTGAEGIELFRQHTYDAVLLDLSMPGMDGLETMTHLLQINPKVQIIILTGQGSVAAGVEAMKQGASDFVEKPADIGELVDKFSEAQSKRLEQFEADISNKMSDIMRKKGW